METNKIKLLIVTQKVAKDDPILGFFHNWIKNFSKHFDQVTVICLEHGSVDLPQNVRVLSLGKETKKSRFQYVFNFYSYIWRERAEYDAVFVHMNPIYVVLGGIVWKILGKKIGLWYVHKHVDLKLRIAAFFVDVIFTASPESFRLKSKKLNVVGHGIDTQIFSPRARGTGMGCALLSVGRISKTKNQHLMVEVVERLCRGGFSVRLIIVGSGITPEDRVYENGLHNYVAEHSLGEYVKFVGNVAPDQVVAWYHDSSIFLNLSDTGSLDKAVLEAMASGLQVLTSNEAFARIVPSSNFTENNIEKIASKIMFLSTATPDAKLREYVVNEHNIANLIPKLSQILKSNEK